MKKVRLMMVLSVLLTGCSAQYTSNGEQQYLQSRNGVNLVVPPPLTAENISDFYNLPAQNQDARVSVAPPPG
mgnify:CR=1 FL=1